MGDQQQHYQQKFSAAALSEATAAVKRAHQVIRDRKAVKGITIDGPQSKDLDDAFWLEKTTKGGYLLQISIADVASLIDPGSTPALDEMAFERSFTRYFADHTLPMLPAKVSEDGLSLLEGKLRPSITMTIPLDARLRLGEVQIAPTCMKSSRRWSYQDVDEEVDCPLTEFGPMLRQALELAQSLLQLRKKKGALTVYDLSAGWTTTEEGILRPLAEGERYKAQIITQEFMILANQVFASFLAQRNLPALYRNHKAIAIAPDRSTLLQMMDSALAHPELTNPERISDSFTLVLERARYASTVEGHYGLNLPAYIHLTSPLRRYPDLINQRILLAAIRGEPLPYSQAQLDEIADYVNWTENEIKEARRKHFLAAYEKEIIALVEEAIEEDGSSATPLAHLDTRQFHSVLRMTAEGSLILPAVEQEIFRRLSAHLLQPNDLFTLVYRYQNSGELWEKIKIAVVQELQQQPYHAVTLLMMGYQSLGWSEPMYQFVTVPAGLFGASVYIQVAGHGYASSVWQATQKDLARQLASVDILAQIAGVELSLWPSEYYLSPAAGADNEQTPIPEQVESVESEEEEEDLFNYKGQLQEVVQARKWSRPVYREVERFGPPHAPTFIVEGTISVGGTVYAALARGSSKSKAEQGVAEQLLQMLPTTDTVENAPVSPEKNPVTVLHEMRQCGQINSVDYDYLSQGFVHDPTFTCICTVTLASEEVLESSATAGSKKKAAQQAAAQMLDLLATALHPENSAQ